MTDTKTRCLQIGNILILLATIVLIDLHFIYTHTPDANPHLPEPSPIPMPGPDNAIMNLLTRSSDHFADYHFFTGLLLPAWSFYMTAIIHLILFIPLVLQFTDKGKKVIVDAVSWRFMAVSIVSIFSYASWVALHPVWAFIFATITFGLTFDLLIQLQKSEVGRPFNWFEAALYYPFSLLQGWSLVCVIWNAWLVFPHGLDTKLSRTFYDLTLLVFEIASLGFAFSGSRGELGGNIPISYALITTACIKQAHFYQRSAIIAAFVSLLITAKSIWTTSEDIRGGAIQLNEANSALSV